MKQSEKLNKRLPYFMKTDLKGLLHGEEWSQRCSIETGDFYKVASWKKLWRDFLMSETKQNNHMLFQHNL